MSLQKSNSGSEDSYDEQPIYENYTMLDPDSKFLCYNSEKKIKWYLSRGLATKVDDFETTKTIKLNFHPNIVSTHPYYEQKLVNRCVVCGSDEWLERTYIVPRKLRLRFPKEEINRNHHDVLPFCEDCKDDLNDRRKVFEKDLIDQYDIQVRVKGKDLDPSLKHKRLKKYDQFAQAFKQKLGPDFWWPVTKLYRQQFLDSMQPQFLPKHWDVNFRNRLLMNQSTAIPTTTTTTRSDDTSVANGTVSHINLYRKTYYQGDDVPRNCWGEAYYLEEYGKPYRHMCSCSKGFCQNKPMDVPVRRLSLSGNFRWAPTAYEQDITKSLSININGQNSITFIREWSKTEIIRSSLSISENKITLTFWAPFLEYDSYTMEFTLFTPENKLSELIEKGKLNIERDNSFTGKTDVLHKTWEYIDQRTSQIEKLGQAWCQCNSVICAKDFNNLDHIQDDNPYKDWDMEALDDELYRLSNRIKELKDEQKIIPGCWFWHNNPGESWYQGVGTSKHYGAKIMEDAILRQIMDQVNPVWTIISKYVSVEEQNLTDPIPLEDVAKDIQTTFSTRGQLGTNLQFILDLLYQTPYDFPTSWRETIRQVKQKEFTHLRDEKYQQFDIDQDFVYNNYQALVGTNQFRGDLHHIWLTTSNTAGKESEYIKELINRSNQSQPKGPIQVWTSPTAGLSEEELKKYDSEIEKYTTYYARCATLEPKYYYTSSLEDLLATYQQANLSGKKIKIITKSYGGCRPGNWDFANIGYQSPLDQKTVDKLQKEFDLTDVLQE